MLKSYLQLPANFLQTATVPPLAFLAVCLLPESYLLGEKGAITFYSAKQQSMDPSLPPNDDFYSYIRP